MWNRFYKAVATSIYFKSTGEGFQGYPETATKSLEIHKQHLKEILTKAIKDGKTQDMQNAGDSVIKIYVDELVESQSI